MGPGPDPGQVTGIVVALQRGAGGVVLANGKRCTFLSGGTAVGPGGHRLNYACGRSARAGFRFGTANRSQPTWTIRFAGTPDPRRYRRVKIHVAWR